jgi:hypothetical protein
MTTTDTYEIANMIQELAKQTASAFHPTDDKILALAYEAGFLKGQILDILAHVPQNKLKQISQEISYRLKK